MVNELQVYRLPQEDMTMSVSEAQVSKGLPNELAKLLLTLASSHTIRTYRFPSLPELHEFQHALTGYTVLFDGIAASLAIARRRMVVPIYKKWDATLTRLQIIRQDRVVQLVAFFVNFSHGECMNFALKGTDVFETSARNGRFLLRIVDAKFALPQKVEGTEGAEKGFLCLDMPDYPGEHDDITVTFDREEGELKDWDHGEVTLTLSKICSGSARHCLRLRRSRHVLVLFEDERGACMARRNVPSKDPLIFQWYGLTHNM